MPANDELTNKEVFPALTAEIGTWEGLKKAAKDAGNAANRQETVVTNLFKRWMQIEDYPAKTTIDIDGIKYKWATTEEDVIDPKKFYAMIATGEITEEQFFSAIKVGKAPAVQIIGEDQVATITTTVSGKKADLRRDDKEAGKRTGTIVTVPGQVKRKGGIKAKEAPAPKLHAPIKPIASRKVILRK